MVIVNHYAIALGVQALRNCRAQSVGRASNKHDFVHNGGYDAAPRLGQGHSVDVPSRLPDPSPPELALSAELRLRIVNEIKANDGFLPFDRYMTLALFEPGLGYYMNGSRKFGAEGDFVTAPIDMQRSGR